MPLMKVLYKHTLTSYSAIFLNTNYDLLTTFMIDLNKKKPGSFQNPGFVTYKTVCQS